MSEYNTKSTYFLSVTIRRNIGELPMTEQRRTLFTLETAITVGGAGTVNDVLFSGEGEGVWDGDGRYSEEDTVIVFFDPENVQGGIDGLNNALARLASKYQQDTIARALVPLPKGDETLVYANK